MTELCHSDAQAYEVKDFKYLFCPRQREQVPVFGGLKKYDDCIILVNNSIFFKICIFQNELIVFNWSLFPNQKSHRSGLALKLQSFK